MFAQLFSISQDAIGTVWERWGCEPAPRIPPHWSVVARGQPLHRGWRSPGLLWSAGAAAALGHLCPTGELVRQGVSWLHTGTGRTKTCYEGPSFASPITPEGCWLVERANVWSFPFLPPNDLHNARATDPSVVSLTVHSSDIIISNCRSQEP